MSTTGAKETAIQQSIHSILSLLTQDEINKLKKKLKNLKNISETGNIFEIKLSSSTKKSSASAAGAPIATEKSYQFLAIKDVENKTRFYIFEPHNPAFTLGKGGQGTVYLGQDFKRGELVAIKLHNASCIAEDRERERRNLGIVKELIGVASIGASSDAAKQQHYTVMPIKKGKELINLLYEIDESKEDSDPAYFISKRKLEPKYKLRLVVGILLQVVELHTKYGLAHKDLKPTNFLVDPDATYPRVNLIDWGSAVVFKKSDSHQHEPDNDKEFIGTPGYVAPEWYQVRQKRPFYGFAQDYWSLGVTIAEILTECNFQADLLKWGMQYQEEHPGTGVEFLEKDLKNLMPDIFENTKKEFATIQDKGMEEALLSVIHLLLQPCEERDKLITKTGDKYPLELEISKLVALLLAELLPASLDVVEEIRQQHGGLRAFRASINATSTVSRDMPRKRSISANASSLQKVNSDENKLQRFYSAVSKDDMNLKDHIAEKTSIEEESLPSTMIPIVDKLEKLALSEIATEKTISSEIDGSLLSHYRHHRNSLMVAKVLDENSAVVASTSENKAVPDNISEASKQTLN